MIEWVGFNVDWFRGAAVLLLIVGLVCLIYHKRSAFVFGGFSVLVNLFVHLAIDRPFWAKEDVFILVLLAVCWFKWAGPKKKPGKAVGPS